MSKILRSALLIIMLAFVSTSFANHILGGNLSYTCLGGNTYGVTLTYYKDCFGATVEPAIEILDVEALSGSCLSFSAPLSFQSVTEISDLCLSEMMNNSCNGGFTPGVLEVVYYGEVVLDPACVWEMAWDTGDWNYFINTDNSMIPLTYMDLEIDPNAPCIETPVATSNGAPFACAGEDITEVITFDNPSGLDLEFYFTDALTTAGASMIYEGGFTGAEPIPGITLDPITGEINFTAPLVFGNYVVAIEVLMYDSGVLVETWMHTITFVVRPCGSETIFSDPPVIDVNPEVTLTDPTTIEACVGDSICFTVQAENSNAFRNVNLSSDFASTVFSSGTFDTEPDNPAFGEFCVLVDATMVGSNVLHFDAIDDACELPSSDELDVTIVVSPTVEAPFLDTLVCVGTELFIELEGDVSFDWNVLAPAEDPGLIPGATSQTFTPVESMDIELVSTNAEAFCNAVEILSIEVSLYAIDTLITDETCAFNDGAIDLTPIGGSGDYDFAWDLPATTEDISGLAGGVYEVTIIDNASADQCELTAIIEVEGITPPSLSISGDATICENDCHQIQFEFEGQEQFTIQLVDVTNDIPIATGPLNALDSVEVCPLETTTYEVQWIEDGNTPPCSDLTIYSITVNVVPTVNAIFEEPNDVCIGSNAELVFDIDQTGVFEIVTSLGTFNASDGDLIPDVLIPDSPTEFSIESVSYTTGLSCTNSTLSTVDIAINDLPTAVLSGDTAICFQDLGAAFDLEVTGVGPWEVDYTVFGNSTVSDFGYPVDAASFDFPIGITANPTSQEYCIDVVYDLGTGCSQDVTTCANVDIEVIPSIDYGGSDYYQICPGDVVEETDNELFPGSFDLDGNPYEFDIVMQITNSMGVIDSTIQNVNFLNLNLSPTETTSYDLLYVIDSTGTAFCGTDIVGEFTIEVFELPTLVTPLDTICDPAGEEYVVSYEITGGDVANYEVIGQFFDITGLGNLVDNVYTSGPIPSGFGETWTIDDGHPCDLLTYTISAYECPIVTYSGTIDTTATIQSLCEDGTYCVVHELNEVLDPNDVLSFAIIDNEEYQFANVISISDIDCWDVTADIGFPPLVYEQTYYAVAIAGNDDGSGLVDLTNPNISVSNPAPITFYQIPTATVTGGGVICDGDTSIVNVQLTGFAPYDFEIYVDGVLDSVVTEFDGETFVYEVTQGMDYTVQTLTNEYCIGTTGGLGTVIVNPLPTGVLSADASICDDEVYSLQLDFTGTPNYDVVLTYEDEDGGQEDIAINDIAASPFNFDIEEPGEYYLTQIQDANCLNSDTTAAITLTVFELPTASFVSSDTSYCSGSNIEIDIALTGLSDFDLTYNFNADPLILENSVLDTITLLVDAEGTINLVSIVDANNCTADLVETINIIEIETPIADAGPDVFVCSEIDQIVGTPEIAPFEYVWTGSIEILDDDSIAQPTVNVENPNEGMDEVYDLILTLNNEQCTSTDDLQVTILWEPVVDAGDETLLCNGENVQLNGVGGIACLWEPDPSFIDALDLCNPTVAPTDTTMYYLSVEGANGCFNTDSVLVIVPEPIAFDVVFDATLCFGVCDGDIEITPSGSYGTFTVDWETAGLTDFIEGDLCPAIYNFTVSDAQNCAIDGSVEITELAEYFLDDVILTASTCFDGSNGQIQVVSGTAVEYTISIPDTNDTGIFSNLEIGFYDVSAINNIGCVAEETVELTSLSDQIDLDISIDVIEVCFEEPVEIEGEATGGNGAFEYFWYDCIPSPICLIENNDLTTVIPTEDTEIWLVAIDGNGCSSDTLTSMINLAPELFINNETDDDIEICQGECIILEGNASGGNGMGIVTWEIIDPDEILGTDDEYEVCPLEDQSYLATITDGCSEPLVYQVDVTVFESPVVEILADGESGCYHVELTLSIIILHVALTIVL